MKKTSLGLTALVILASGLVFISCGSKEKTTAGEPGTKSLTPSGPAKSAQQDYTQPYLTDEKMTKFVASMKEERNPFELIFKESGQGLGDIQDRLEEYNAYAKKYGFQDYSDYISVWGRITVGEMMLWSESMNESSIKSMQDSIARAEEELKKPDLNPEMKKIYEDQIVNYKKSIADMQSEKKDESSLNAADLELVKKYKPELDQAAEKYKKQTN